MKINSKKYDFSLDDSEIRVIKRVLNTALCLSHSDNEGDKRHEFVNQLCELFIDPDGHCTDAYNCVANFSHML